jgi:hypothetical protein
MCAAACIRFYLISRRAFRCSRLDFNHSHKGLDCTTQETLRPCTGTIVPAAFSRCDDASNVTRATISPCYSHAVMTRAYVAYQRPNAPTHGRDLCMFSDAHKQTYKETYYSGFHSNTLLFDPTPSLLSLKMCTMIRSTLWLRRVCDIRALRQKVKTIANQMRYPK